MRLQRPIRARRTISLTSLIDVIFLLLMFFMLSTSFSQYVEIPITNSRSGDGENLNQEVQVFVIELEAEATKLNRDPVDPKRLLQTIESQIDGEAYIYLVAREGVFTDELIMLFSALRGIPQAHVSLLDDRARSNDV